MNPWQCLLLQKEDSYVKLQFTAGAQPLSFQAVFELWQQDTAFIDFYTQQLLEQIGDTFFWEHPPLRQQDLGEAYEVILQKGWGFHSRPVNTQAFDAHFTPGQAVVAFDNLGKDARLVVPTRLKAPDSYKHMGAFLTHADQAQIHALFQRVGKEVLHRLQQGKQLWLNTAGLGVIWLHVRLDSRPKYYKTRDYIRGDYFG